MIIAGEVELRSASLQAVYHRLHTGWYGVVTLHFLVGIYLVWQTNSPRNASTSVSSS